MADSFLLNRHGLADAVLEEFADFAARGGYDRAVYRRPPFGAGQMLPDGRSPTERT